MTISKDLLKIDEALEIANICDRWPGGIGCVLIPKETSKRKYVNGNWGWRGHIPGNFNYALLKDLPDGTIFCPVTFLGMMRGAQNFQDHQSAYRIILNAVIEITRLEEEKAKKYYNDKLREDQHTLASLFRNYAYILQNKNDLQLQSNAQYE